ncbi:hypothetical protein BJV78DRAFT_560957 [Lactifluus subvellereus]|nr:hypothetical protein BJV78DRAFT_560957 [Lactifluus subvellereus]
MSLVLLCLPDELISAILEYTDYRTVIACRRIPKYSHSDALYWRGSPPDKHPRYVRSGKVSVYLRPFFLHIYDDLLTFADDSSVVVLNWKTGDQVAKIPYIG